jgi:hypothetical protein
MRCAVIPTLGVENEICIGRDVYTSLFSNSVCIGKEILATRSPMLYGDQEIIKLKIINIANDDISRVSIADGLKLGIELTGDIIDVHMIV